MRHAPDALIERTTTPTSDSGAPATTVVAGAHNDLLMFFHTKTTGSGDGRRLVRYAPISFNAAGNMRFDVPPPGDSAPGHNSCKPRPQ
jgi:hypothetical protein